MNGLTAAARAAAGTGHDLDKVIADLAPLKGIEQLPRVAESAHHRDLHLARRRNVEARLLPAVHAAHGGEGVGIGVLAGHEVVRRAERGVHHAAGRAEHDRRARAAAERGVELLLRQMDGGNVVRAEHNVQLACGDAHIDIGNAVLAAHGRKRTLALLCDARHDGHDEQPLGINADLLGKVGLGNGAEHLLRGLRGGKLLCPLGVLRLEEAHPARAAGGEHRPAVVLFVREAFEKFAALLHDGEVGGKVGVEHIVEAQLAQSSRHALGRGKLRRKVELLRPGRAHRRRDLHDRDGVGVVDGVKDDSRVVALPQRRRGAMRDALAAVGTFRILDAAIARGVHRRAGAGAEQIPYLHGLYVLADLDAAHTLHALVVLADERRGVVHRLPAQLGGIVLAAHIEVVRERLQRAVAAARAARAARVVLGEDQPQVGAARLARHGAVGKDLHAVRHHIVARGDKALHALDLHAAQTAGSDLVDVL